MTEPILYEISTEAVKPDYEASFNETNQAKKIYEKIMYVDEISESLTKQIKELVDKYPHNPQFKNYLGIAYNQNGEKEAYEALIEEILEKHPNYLFGKTMAAEKYLKDGNAEKAAEILGNFTTLKSLYPERKTFHPVEIQSYHGIAVEYHAFNRNDEQAILHLQILRKAGIDKDTIERIADRAERFMLIGGLSRMKDDFGNSKYNKIDGVFKAENQQTDVVPTFNHPIIDELYFNGLGISIELLERILTLDHTTLIQDLEKVATDAIYRFNYFKENFEEYDESQSTFVVHAIQLLTELKSYDSLKIILELLKQHSDFENLWFGDMQESFFMRPLFLLGKERMADLLTFMKEPMIDWIAKSSILNTFFDIAIIEPERKEEIVKVFDELLDFYWQNKDDKTIYDAGVLSNISQTIFELQADTLYSKLKLFFDEDLVDVTIAGDWKEVQEELTEPSTFEAIPIYSLKEQYEIWANGDWGGSFTKKIPHANKKARYQAEFEKISMSLYEKAFGKEKASHRISQSFEPIISEKINRNDRVTVKYTDGKTVTDVKYKKVEDDINAGKCFLM
jgi:Protein of unknown function (DUF1186)